MSLQRVSAGRVLLAERLFRVNGRYAKTNNKQLTTAPLNTGHCYDARLASARRCQALIGGLVFTSMTRSIQKRTELAVRFAAADQPAYMSAIVMNLPSEFEQDNDEGSGMANPRNPPAPAAPCDHSKHRSPDH